MVYAQASVVNCGHKSRADSAARSLGVLFEKGKRVPDKRARPDSTLVPREPRLLARRGH
jgi:hypothetical protein